MLLPTAKSENHYDNFDNSIYHICFYIDYLKNNYILHRVKLYWVDDKIFMVYQILLRQGLIKLNW